MVVVVVVRMVAVGAGGALSSYGKYCTTPIMEPCTLKHFRVSSPLLAGPTMTMCGQLGSTSGSFTAAAVAVGKGSIWASGAPFICALLLPLFKFVLFMLPNSRSGIGVEKTPEAASCCCCCCCCCGGGGVSTM